MTRPKTYRDLKGQVWDLAVLDPEERRLVADLQRRAATKPDWYDFDNHRREVVLQLYDGRGIPRKKTTQTAVYRIAQDLSSRLMIAAGLARESDYRDELDELVRTRFKSRREFCEATGLSEDMLSHVLARRKHLSIGALSEALDRIGYSVRFVPNGNPSPTPKATTKVG